MCRGRRAGVNSPRSAGPVRENRVACAGDWNRGAWWEVESLRRRPHATGRRGELQLPAGSAATRRAGPAPGPPVGPAVPARPGEHGGIAPPALERRSEGFVSAIEFLAVRSEQQRPTAVDGLHGVGGGHTSAWPGFRDRHRPRPLGTPGCRPEHKAALPQRHISPLKSPGTCSHCQRSCISEMLYYCRTCLWER